MKAPILASCLVLLLVIEARTQGRFAFSNPTAPTHLGSIDGPLASSSIWAQMLVGRASDRLSPVDEPWYHFTNGIVYRGPIIVPGVDPLESVYVQMVAWDGQLWGNNLAKVPQDQLGRTDIVSVFLGDDILPSMTPRFTQSAIVPIPEPAVALLAVVGAGVVAGYRCLRRLRARVRGDTRRLWTTTRRPRTDGRAR